LKVRKQGVAEPRNEYVILTAGRILEDISFYSIKFKRTNLIHTYIQQCRSKTIIGAIADESKSAIKIAAS
jgi:hypothetical protein